MNIQIYNNTLSNIVLKPEPCIVTPLMLLVCCCLLLRASLAAQDDEDYEDYEYSDEVKLTSLRRKDAGARLVNARATAASEYQFVGAFFLSSSSRLRSPTCTAALITQDVALRSPVGLLLKYLVIQ